MLDKPRILYPLLGVMAVVLLLPHLLLPLNSDNDTYQAMALAMDQGRGLPYLGSWDQNFPGIVFYHWVGIKAFGLSDLGFRLIDILNRVAIALLCYAIAKRFVDHKIALFAIPLVCFHYLGSGFWNAGQRDGFAVTWLLVALYQFTRPDTSTRSIVIASASIALATFIRPTNAIFLLLTLPFLWHSKHKLSAFSSSIGGFGCTVLVLLLPWIVTENGITEFMRATISFNVDVYAGERDTASNLLDSLSVHLWFYVLALVGLAISLGERKDKKRQLLLGYVLLAIAVIGIMGKYHIYHFEILLPATIILCLISIGWLSKITGRPVIVGSAFFLAGFFLFYPIRLAGQFIKHGANEASLQRVYHNLASFPGFSLQTEENVIAYVRANGEETDIEYLLLWPGLRWRSEESGLTRFTTTFALTMEGEKGLAEYQRGWRREVDSTLIFRRPSIIVAATGPEYLFRYSRISPDSLLKSLPGTSAMLLQHYSLDTAIGGYRIYSRNDASL